MDEKSRPTRAVSERELLRVVDTRLLFPNLQLATADPTRGSEEGNSVLIDNSIHPTVGAKQPSNF
jgi:hypothetical protein